MRPNVWRYMLPPQHRGGTCFCPRVGVQYFSIRYKVFGVCKNRDTIAGWPVPPLQICHDGHEVFAAQKAVAYTDLLALGLILESHIIAQTLVYHP